jgi:hypothetical protein
MLESKSVLFRLPDSELTLHISGRGRLAERTLFIAPGFLVSVWHAHLACAFDMGREVTRASYAQRIVLVQRL